MTKKIHQHLTTPIIRTLWLGSVSLVFITGFVYYSIFHTIAEWPESSDFYKFYLSGERFNNGQSMYWLNPPRSKPADACHDNVLENSEGGALAEIDERLRLPAEHACLHPNLNPPFTAVLFSPLAKLDYTFAVLLWSSLNIAAILIGLLIIFREYKLPEKFKVMAYLSAASTLLLYHPVQAGFELGQLTGILFLLTVSAWQSMAKGQHISAGFFLGLATAIKPFFGIFFFSLAFAKAWRPLLWMFGVLTSSLLIGFWLTGIEGYRDYAMIGSDVSWFSVNWNASFRGFFSRILGGSENVPLYDAPFMALFLSKALSFIIVFVLYFHISKTQNSSNKILADTIFSLSLPAMLLISPLGWLYYFPLLLVSVLIGWQPSVSMKKIWFHRASLMFFLSFCSIQYSLQPARSMTGATEIFGNGSFYFYQLIFLTLILISGFRRNEI